MEGEYVLRDRSGEERSARVPRFDLNAENATDPQ
jgi:uncharacterized protein affecting Mg2+/Co2+ transport